MKEVGSTESPSWQVPIYGRKRFWGSSFPEVGEGGGSEFPSPLAAAKAYADFLAFLRPLLRGEAPRLEKGGKSGVVGLLHAAGRAWQWAK